MVKNSTKQNKNEKTNTNEKYDAPTKHLQTLAAQTPLVTASSPTTPTRVQTRASAEQLLHLVPFDAVIFVVVDLGNSVGRDAEIKPYHYCVEDDDA